MNDCPSRPDLRHPIAKGWAVHCVTAFGAVCGMFGIIAVADGNEQAAIVWLMVALILDGIDGPVARAWAVAENVPRIDGYTLDLVVDFVTCIVIPVIFLYQFDMLPQGWALFIGAYVLFMSALWMSRTDQMTEDHWFNGFPGEWNMVVPTMYLLGTPPWLTAFACVVLASTGLTNWKFVHPMQVRFMRKVTVTVTISWIAIILLMTLDWPDSNEIGRWLLAACPLYIFGLGIWRTLDPSATGGTVESQQLATSSGS